MSRRRLRFSTISLGCSKNMVDTQNLLGRMLWLGQNNANWDVEYYADPDEDDITHLFLNTCGFLRSGRLEMLEIVKKYIDAGKKIYVMGCGSEYFEATRKLDTPLLQEEDDDYTERKRLLQSGKMFLLSRKDLEKVSLTDIVRGYSSVIFDGFVFNNNPRAYTNAMYGYEYCKIAEGCNNSCSFCIIPKIRGKQRSRDMAEVITDIEQMTDAGIGEIILLAQDTTRYGVDKYGRPMLFDLLDQIEAMPQDFALRLLYMYPDVLTLQHLRRLTEFKKLVPYFDIPLQHISSSVLKRMGRFYDEDYLHLFLKTIAELFPIRYMRTNYIIGFPGETEEDFQKLLDFMKQDVFDSVALFEYHDEALAPSSKLDQKVPDDVVHSRFLRAKAVWDELYQKRQDARIGHEYTGTIISYDQENDEVIVRPRLHAPDIDPTDIVSIDAIVGGSKDGYDVGDSVTYRL